MLTLHTYIGTLTPLSIKNISGCYLFIHEVHVSVHTYSGDLTVRVAKVNVVFDSEVGHHLEELQEVLTRSLLIQVQS